MGRIALSIAIEVEGEMNFLIGEISLCRTELAKIKKKALRHGIWFKILSRIERIQMDLTVKVVDKVKSILLAKVLRSIIVRLFDAMESQVKRLMRDVGTNLAHKIGEIGKKLGCKSAENWANDQGFIKFLTITYMNTPRLYKISV